MKFNRRGENVRNEEDKEELIEFITQDDGIEYIIVDEIETKRGHYVYLVNVQDETDICVKKLNGEEIYPLENDKEFEYCMYIFAKKNKGKIENLLKEEGRY